MIEMTRLLPIEGASNMRDLGGYEAAEGKHVKWRTLLRSDELCGLTDADLDYLSGLGVSRETILQDYLLSAGYLEKKYGTLAKAYPSLAPMLTVQQEYLEAAFQVIDQHFGGVDNYLTHYLQADMEKLRGLYTE